MKVTKEQMQELKEYVDMDCCGKLQDEINFPHDVIFLLVRIVAANATVRERKRFSVTATHVAIVLVVAGIVWAIIMMTTNGIPGRP